MSIVYSAADIIKTLDLQPHPEGGWYRETFRDATSVLPNGRSSGTMIYYLLEGNDRSHVHRIDACEGWHFYAGHPLNVIEVSESGPKITRLGNDFMHGDRPQYLVEKDTWFGACLADGSEWALVGCTVAPGFDFEHFELGERTMLTKEFPLCTEWIERLTKDKQSS